MSPDVPKSRPSTLAGPEKWKAKARQTFCHWDRWFLMLLVADHGGDWDGLLELLRERDRKAYGSSQNDTEAKWSHLHDLRRRVALTRLEPEQILGTDAQDGRLLRKARTKVLEQHVPERHKTRAMRETPRRLLGERARRGNWDGFPQSPSQFEPVFLDQVEANGHFNLDATFDLCRRLEGASS